MDKSTEFLTKLFALMKEYNADIQFYCDGDTYGISGEKMIVEVDGKPVHANSGYWLEEK